MNRTIERSIIFSIDEVKEALIALLEKNSQQAPSATDPAVAFEVGEDGARLTWRSVDQYQLD